VHRRSAVERSRARRRLLTSALAVTGLLIAALGSAAPASAGIKQEFEVFNQCPLSNPETSVCVYSTTTSGEFHLGSNTVPVTKTVVLQGGLSATSADLIPAANGETLSKTELELPGGLTGVELLGNLNEVGVVAELAGTPEVFVPAFGKREGTAVHLPIVAKLENSALGATCTVGSASEPAELNLTTGTTDPPEPNKPISGSSGKLGFKGAGKINVFENNSLVDNAFAAPGASGCDEPLSVVVDEAVDVKAGLPAAAGKNAAVLTGTLEQASSTNVIRVDALPEIGRCVKVPSERVDKTTVYHGLYVDAGCTYEEPQKEAKYEWEPGLESKGFTGSSKVVTLETFGKKKIACTESSETGEFTGLKTATMSVTLTGCTHTSNKEPCQSSGADSGEISIPSVSGELGFLEDMATSEGIQAKVGMDLKHEPSIISATCGSEAVTVTGSVIAPVASIDKMVATNSLSPKQKAGAQAPESFEEEAKDVLSATIGSGVEQAGLQTAIKVAPEEKFEIKALAE
jgi:hypothetical protein